MANNGPLPHSEPVLGQYPGSIDLPEKVPPADAVNEYLAKRYDVQKLLAATRLPGEDEKAPGFDKRIEDAVKANPALEPAVKQFKDALGKAFTNTKTEQDWNKDFQAYLQQIFADAKLSPPPKGFNIVDIPRYIEEVKKEGLVEIKKRHDAEDLAVKNATVPTIPNLPNLQDDLQRTLEAKHKAEIADFNKTCDGMKTEITRNLFGERQRIAYLKKLCEMSDKYRDAIDAKSQKAPSTSTTLGGSSPTDRFKGVKLSMLDEFTTITGNGVNKAGDGFSISIPGNTLGRTLKYWTGVFTPFTFSRDADLADLTMLAQAMMAEGVEHITMTISCRDPEKAMELARKAYEGCILAGYPPENITIKAPYMEGKDDRLETRVVSGFVGKDKPRIDPSEKLFAGDEGRLKILHEQGKEARKALQSSIDMSGKDPAAYIQTMKQSVQQQPQQQPQQQQSNNSAVPITGPGTPTN